MRVRAGRRWIAVRAILCVAVTASRLAASRLDGTIVRVGWWKFSDLHFVPSITINQSERAQAGRLMWTAFEALVYCIRCMVLPILNETPPKHGVFVHGTVTWIWLLVSYTAVFRFQISVSVQARLCVSVDTGHCSTG